MTSYYDTAAFEEKYTYRGDDLGAVYNVKRTRFRVWAPDAEQVAVKLYRSGDENAADGIGELAMRQAENGTWTAEKQGDLNGVYYTYAVRRGEEWIEACDPYARTAGVNGKRGMIIDLAATNPSGWEQDKNPHAGERITDAVIYELHVRDLSVDEHSGIRNKGKFLGIAETGTTNGMGNATGLDHIKELGATHLHLLPFFDYGSVDETKLQKAQFNWGYDPVNYNVPEGSYSTDPFHGATRVKELKQMVKTLHDNGISVIMDVVYNHVYDAKAFCMNRIVPGYFSRTWADGSYSNGSGCGNDTASERSMVRRYIVDSVRYWATEYHIDGFRFDLVGLIDTETIRQTMAAVKEARPDVIFYGEGWTMETAARPGVHLTTQENAGEVPGFAFFSDTMRDVLKGSVFYYTQPGYVSGAQGLEKTVEACFSGKAPEWCKSPEQAINYASCHDNMTLLDRIISATPDRTQEEWTRMNNLAAAIYLLAEGIPLLQAGEEFLRRKTDARGRVVENSYASPDEVNRIRWELLAEPRHQAVYQYYRGLIAFRKAHPLLRLATADETARCLNVVETGMAGVLAFWLKKSGGVPESETAGEIYLLYNANRTAASVKVPVGTWNICVDGRSAGTGSLGTQSGGKVVIAPISALALVKL